MNKFRWKILWIVSISLLFSNPLSAEEMYRISPDGMDSPTCDGVNQPWKNISYALLRIPEVGGVTIQVEPGEYSSITCTKSFQNPVRIYAHIPYESFLVPNEAHGPIFFNHAEQIQLEGFIIDNRNRGFVSNAVHLLAGSSHITIRNSVITNGSEGYPYADAVKIHQNSHHIRFEGNVIFDGREEEVEIADDCSDVVFRRNVIMRQFSPSCAPLFSVKRRCRRIAVDANIFSSWNRELHHGVVNIGSAIQGGEETQDVLLMNNVFAHAGGRFTMGLTGCLRVLIAKNQLIQFSQAESGIDLYHRYPQVQSPMQFSPIFVRDNIFIRFATLELFTWIRNGENVPSPLEDQNTMMEFDVSCREIGMNKPNYRIDSDTEDGAALPEKLNQWLQEYLQQSSEALAYE